MVFASSARAAEDRTRGTRIVVKSSVVPLGPRMIRLDQQFVTICENSLFDISNRRKIPDHY